MVTLSYVLQGVTPQAFVLRPNYGVAFIQKKPVLVSNSYFHQSFAVAFPKVEELRTAPHLCGQSYIHSQHKPSSEDAPRNRRATDARAPAEPAPSTTPNLVDWYLSHNQKWNPDGGSFSPPKSANLQVIPETIPHPETKETPLTKKRTSRKQKANKAAISELENRMCERFSKLLSLFHTELETLQTHLKENEQVVSDLLEPELRLHRLQNGENLRNKRGLFDAVGKIFRPLFGIATTDDIEILAGHVNSLEHFVNESAQESQRYREKLDAVTVTTNRRITTAFEKINQNFGIIEETVSGMSELGDRVRDMERDIGLLWRDLEMQNAYSNALMRATLMNLQTIETIMVESDQRVQGVQTLLQGFLPIQLVPTPLLKAALANVTNQLRDTHPNFRLAFSNLYQYYKTPGVVYTHTDDYLYMKIRLPLVSESTHFELYQVLTATIPATSNPSINGVHATDGTRIQGTAAYFGISRDQYYHLELTKDQFDACSDRFAGHCAQLMPMKEVESSQSCTLALYKDQPEEVRKLCKISYLFDTKIPEAVIDLGLNNLLVTSPDKTWTRKCFNAPPVTIDGCTFCLVQPKCGCAIQTSTFYIPPTLYACTDLHSQTTQKHFVNLPMLQSFYDTEELSNITGSTSFHKEFKLSLPDMAVERAKRDMYAQREVEYDIDLAKTTRLMNESKVPYYSAVDYLMDTSLHGFSKGSKIMFWMGQIAMIGIMIVLMTMIIFLWKKMRRLENNLTAVSIDRQIEASVEPPKRQLPKVKRKKTKFANTDSECSQPE